MSTSPATAADPLARFRLDGRVAIVTGGGRGIGRTLSQGLAAVGASVVVAGRTESACAETVAAIEAAGGAALAVATDIGRSEDRIRLVEAAVERFGRLDVVINNAAILKPHLTVKVTEAELRELLAVNVEGPVFLSQHALPHLAATGHGSIVNLSALGAFQPMPGIGAYCAVKAAMVNWTSTMAKEWAAQGVRVNALVPGPVATDMILPRDPEKRAAFVDDIASQTLIGRVAAPDDLVGATIFLASDASSYMTGRSLFVDGGMLV